MIYFRGLLLFPFCLNDVSQELEPGSGVTRKSFLVPPECTNSKGVVCKAYKWMKTVIIWLSIIYSIYTCMYICGIYITFIYVYKISI